MNECFDNVTEINDTFKKVPNDNELLSDCDSYDSNDDKLLSNSLVHNRMVEFMMKQNDELDAILPVISAIAVAKQVLPLPRGPTYNCPIFRLIPYFL